MNNLYFFLVTVIFKYVGVPFYKYMLNGTNIKLKL